jgi:hypothetical protein
MNSAQVRIESTTAVARYAQLLVFLLKRQVDERTDRIAVLGAYERTNDTQRGSYGSFYNKGASCCSCVGTER